MIDNRNSPIFRNLILGVEQKIPLPNGSIVTPVNFDNAATTPALVSVMDAINGFSPWYSSIHRGTGYKSSFTTEFYESSRKIVANFVNADLNNDVVIYVRNTSDGINRLASTLYKSNNRQVVLATEMEHHSNLLPWRSMFETDLVKVDKYGRISVDDLERKLRLYKGRVGIVAVTGASNVTGYVNPIHEIASICHKYNARIVVDGAQMIPHCKFDMLSTGNSGHIDFLIFSAHKLYAPFGIGVLIGPRADFEKNAPDHSGGGTVKYVTKDKVIWAEAPERNEAGTPNVMGVTALVAAIHALNEIGMDKICRYESMLFEYAMTQLSKLQDLEIYNDCALIPRNKKKNVSEYVLKQQVDSSLSSVITEACSLQTNKNQIGIIAFNIKGMQHEIAAKALAYESGIAVRSGCFCAHPYVQKLLRISSKQRHYFLKHPNASKPGMLRISFGMYNTMDEIDLLADTLKYIIANKQQLIQRYQSSSE